MDDTPILAVELTPKVGGRPIRVASRPYTHATAPGPFFDAILSGSRLRREIFEDGLTFGAASNDYGTLQLANVSGWLDWLDDDGVDAYGGTAVFSLLPSVTAAWEERKPLFAGRLGQPQVGDTVDIRLLDDFALALDRQIAKRRFLGDSVGPVGAEGGEGLKDQWYPVLEGRAFNCPVPLVNSSTLIHCLADRAVAAILVDAVDDKGAPLTRGVNRGSLATLQASTPAAGHWDYALGNATTPAYIRLGSSPNGTVTVTMRSGGTAADRTAAQIWKRVLTSRAGIDAARISADDVAALDALQPAEMGFWTDTGGAQIREQLDVIAGSAGAGYWQDRAGTWRIARIDLPAGQPVATLHAIGAGDPGAVGDADIIKLEPVFTSRDDGGRPYDLTRLRYARNHSVQGKESLAGVALDRVERLSREWLETAHPPGDADAPEPTDAGNEYEADTAFAELTAAATEARRRHGIGGSRRRRLRITTVLTPALAGQLDLNETVRVVHSRYGLAAGRLARIAAIELDLLTLDAELTVWS